MKKICILLSLLCLVACHKKSFEEKVEEDIKNFNEKEAPKVMDEATTLDSMGFDAATHTLYHYYTLKGSADNPKLLTPTVKEIQRNNLLDNLKGNIQLKEYKKQKVIFVYQYYSEKTGKVLLEERFTAVDYNGPSRSYEDKVSLEIKQFNESQLPKKMDETTIMDSVSFNRETRTIGNYYTLIGAADNDTIYNEEVINEQREALLDNIKDNEQLKPYKTQGLNLEFVYRTQKTGKVVMDVTFTAKDYD